MLALGSGFDEVSVFAYLAAFGGGIVSFLSPCVLPLLPAYLSIVTGLDVAALQEGSRAHVRQIVRTTGLFVAGFGVVFVSLGLAASSLGRLLNEHRELLTRLTGTLMVMMALFLLGSLFLRAPWLYQERRFHPNLWRFGTAAPFVAGLAFGFGWSPCIGPILGSINAIALNEEQVWAGATLLAVYTLGLGVPFLVAGLALGRLEGAIGWVKRHFALLVGGSAVVIGAFGLLLMFDSLSRVSAELAELLRGTPFEWLVELG